MRNKQRIKRKVNIFYRVIIKIKVLIFKKERKVTKEL